MKRTDFPRQISLPIPHDPLTALKADDPDARTDHAVVAQPCTRQIAEMVGHSSFTLTLEV